MSDILVDLAVKEREIQLKLQKEQSSSEYKSLFKQCSDLCWELWQKDYYDVFTNDEQETIAGLQIKISWLKQQIKLHEDVESSELDVMAEQVQRYKLKQTWKKAFLTSVKQQPLFAELYYYYFLGQWFFQKKIIMNEKEEDLRIHLTIISPSGIGKSESNDFLSKVATKVGKKVKTVGRVNDASVIGTYSRENEILNEKMKKNPGDEKYKEPKQYGVLYHNQFVVFDEGEAVLKPSQSTEKIQNTLQAVMNRHGSAGNMVSNDLVYGGIQYYPSCSICITSYYLDEFRETLITRGLIQRTILYVQENNRVLRQNIENEVIKSMWTKPGDGTIRISKLDRLIDDFVQELQKINVQEQYIYITPEVQDRLIQYKEEIRKMGVLPQGQQDIFDSMISREVIKMIKISALNALSEGRNIINLHDVEEMYRLFKITNLTSLGFIQENVYTNLDEKISQYISDFRKRMGTSWSSKGDVNKIMSDYWKCSTPTTINRIKKMKNYLEEENVGGIRKIRIKQ